MADMKIVEQAKKKLTELELLNLKDWVIKESKDNFNSGYDKGYQAGRKRTNKVQER